MGARESLNGRKNIVRRKEKNGEKSPWGQCLTRPVPNGRRRSDFWLLPENFCVFLPNQKAERRRPFGTGLVRHCPQELFSPFFTFLRTIFFRPFRLSLAPTICPWVSEDVSTAQLEILFHVLVYSCQPIVASVTFKVPQVFVVSQSAILSKIWTNWFNRANDWIGAIKAIGLYSRGFSWESL